MPPDRFQNCSALQQMPLRPAKQGSRFGRPRREGYRGPIRRKPPDQPDHLQFDKMRIQRESLAVGREAGIDWQDRKSVRCHAQYPHMSPNAPRPHQICDSVEFGSLPISAPRLTVQRTILRVGSLHGRSKRNNRSKRVVGSADRITGRGFNAAGKIIYPE